MEKTVCELFAGVGGFRLGFDRLNSGWETVWFSQWEPGKKAQWAHDCYIKHFGDCPNINGEYHTGEDISTIDKSTIPDHTLLVGGFPCQDYSVAHTLATSKGIEGKKGVLWWEIDKILKEKRPPFVLLENVDRLLKSPSVQSGRDFGIILFCFHALGYSAEWRVINASDYGEGQRRKRIFIFAWQNTTKYAQLKNKNIEEIFAKEGFFAKTFPVKSSSEIDSIKFKFNNLYTFSTLFRYDFKNAGCMLNDQIYTTQVIPQRESSIPLKIFLEKNVDERYFLDNKKIEKIKYLKNSKQIQRTSKAGYKYTFSEGAIPFPDSIEKPARTILTSESCTNRSTHVINDPSKNKLRILTPIETERIQGFDDDWTNSGMPERVRYFCMGNALVVPLITRMGKTLNQIFENE